MARTSAMFGGGVGAAALLGFLFTPQGVPAPATAIKQPGPTVTRPALSVPPPLTLDQSGPWYAVCKEFADIDPEDAESDPEHLLRSQPGTIRHPLGRTDSLVEIEETQKSVHKDVKFLATSHVQGELGSCLPLSVPARVLIGTVPDPIGSHLAFRFDREIAAVEKAALDQGYTLTRFWLPWDHLMKEGTANVDRTRLVREEQELIQRQPGILIFRRPSAVPLGQTEALFIFLIGETPTTGVNKVAFSKALLYSQQLTDRMVDRGGQVPPHRIQIFGPDFSGSFPSLIETLEAAHQSKLMHCLSVQILSPNTTVPALISTAGKQLVEESQRSMKDGCQSILANTLTTLASDTEQSVKELNATLHRLGYHDAEIVSIAEDDTPYGVSSPSKRTTLYFPRDLSALRNDPGSLLSNDFTPATLKGIAIPLEPTRLTLRESAAATLDSPPVFSAEQAPAEIEQALHRIISEITRKHYHAGVVYASNPLDEIFLLQYLRRHAPELRLATFRQEHLLLDLARTEDLRGVLTLTTFPTFGERVVPGCKKGTPSQMPMLDSESNGVYYAVCGLLGQEVGAPPFVSNPLELQASFLGYDGYWPDKREALKAVPLAWTSFTLICLVCSAMELVRSTRGILKRWETHLMVPKLMRLWRRHSAFALTARCIGLMRKSEAQRVSPALLFRLIGLSQLLLFELIVAIPGWFIYAKFEDKRLVGSACISFLLALTTIATFLLCALLWCAMAWNLLKLNRRSCLDWPIIIGLIFVPTYVIWTLLVILSLLRINKDWDPSSISRYISLFNGVSPVPFLVATLAACYLFSRTCRKVLGDVDVRKSDPQWPLTWPSGVRDATADWAKALRLAQSAVHNAIESLFDVNWLIAPALVVSVLLLHLREGMRGLEQEGWFRYWALLCGIALVSGACLNILLTALKIWRRLRSLLKLLDAGPFSGAFLSLHKEDVQAKAWTAIKDGYSYQLHNLTITRLRALSFRTIAGATDQRGDIAEHAIARVLRGDSLGRARQRTHNVAVRCALDAPLGNLLIQLTNSSAAVDALTAECGEYIALRYISMIRYVNRQIRAMLLFVMYGFTVLLLGVLTYPFEGQRSLHLWLSIIFGVVCILILRLLYEMDTDPLLNHLENEPAERTDYSGIAARLINIGGIPALAVIASQFPGVTQFLMSWVRPLLGVGH